MLPLFFIQRVFRQVFIWLQAKLGTQHSFMRLNLSTKQKPIHVHTCRKTGRKDVLAEKQNLKIQTYFPFHILESHFFHIPNIRGEVLTQASIGREITQQPAKENPSAF